MTIPEEEVEAARDARLAAIIKRAYRENKFLNVPQLRDDIDTLLSEIGSLRAAAKVRGARESAPTAKEHIATINLLERPDGGLRVYSVDVVGLVLSGPDPQEVMAKVLPAIRALKETGQ